MTIRFTMSVCVRDAISAIDNQWDNDAVNVNVTQLPSLQLLHGQRTLDILSRSKLSAYTSYFVSTVIQWHCQRYYSLPFSKGAKSYEGGGKLGLNVVLTNSFIRAGYSYGGGGDASEPVLFFQIILDLKKYSM
jgi:hypothetical protein